MNPTAPRQRRPGRGSVLVFVLILIVVTAAAVLKFSERALAEMSGEGYYVQRERLRGEAYSALETTLAVLAQYREIDGGLFAPAQGWGDPLGEAGYEPASGREVTVSFEDENAKLALQDAEMLETPLLALFGDLGFEVGEAGVLTDSLLDWIDRDDNPRPYGAETEDYLRGAPAHVCANRPPRTFAELAAVQGFADLMFTEGGVPNARFDQFTRRVSLWGDGSLNLNTVPDEVLRATGLVGDAQLAALSQALDTVDGDRGSSGSRYYRSLSELAGLVPDLPGGSLFGVQTKVLGVVVTVREREAVFRLRAVVKTDEAGTSANRAANVGGGNAGIRSGSGGTAGAGRSLEYPFRFLELVEDPPPSSIPNFQQSP